MTTTEFRAGMAVYVDMFSADDVTPRGIAAEFIGTLLVVFTGCLAATSESAGLAAIAFAFGLATMVLMFCTADLSGANVTGGNLNPAVSFSQLVTCRMSVPKFAAYVIAQIGGAVVAAFLVQAVKPVGVDGGHTAQNGAQTFPHIAAWQACIIEIIITFAVVFAFWACAIDSNQLEEKDEYGNLVRLYSSSYLAPIPVGFAVIMGIVAAGNLSGGSMNPARSFGPALVSGHWEGHWVYWIGPLFGGLLAGWVYEYAFMTRYQKIDTYAKIDDRQ